MIRPLERSHWGPLAAVVLALAGLAVYARSFSVPFVYDDLPSTVDNPTIRSLWPPWGALAPPHEGGPTVEGRPILNLSLAVNHAISGDAVWSYHAVNLIIHILAGLTLFGIVRRTLRSNALPLAFAIALLWIVHPLQTEAVTYTVQRAESLMGLFYLLTLYCFIRGRFKLCWLACLLGMATKEVMVSAPLMVLLYDRTFIAGSFRQAWRQRRGLYFGLASTWILLAFLVIGDGGNRGGSAGFDVGLKWSAYWLTQFQAVTHYLRLAVWPYPLVFDYGTFWVQDAAQVIPFAAIVGALIAATAVALWRWPGWGFLGAWFFAILAPTSLVPGTIQMIVEHRMYLALAPVVAAVVCGTYRLIGRVSPRAGVVLLAAAAIALGELTIRRNAVYASALSLWSDTVAKRPGNALAHANLASVLAMFPDHWPDAAAHYEAALRINPKLAGAHYHLALVLMRIPGRLPDALEQFEEALRLKPKLAGAHYNLAVALAGIPGRQAEAVAHYEAALQSVPDSADAHYNLARELATMPGQLPEAVVHYKAALRLQPDNADAHNNLAVLYARMGRFDEAIVHFECALKLNPALTGARDNLNKLRAER